MNGGVCVSTGGTHHCECGGGHVGAYCEILYDPCSGSPCFHRGLCYAKEGGKEAGGMRGRKGMSEGKLKEGGMQERRRRKKGREGQQGALIPHSNHSSHEDDFECECEEGFEGRRCEKRVDSCRSNPCFNGGVCALSSNPNAAFICSCPVGFAGMRWVG